MSLHAVSVTETQVMAVSERFVKRNMRYSTVERFQGVLLTNDPTLTFGDQVNLKR